MTRASAAEAVSPSVADATAGDRVDARDALRQNARTTPAFEQPMGLASVLWFRRTWAAGAPVGRGREGDCGSKSTRPQAEAMR